MNKKDLKFILSVLRKEDVGPYADLDWYAAYGFLELNKVSGYFYNAAQEIGLRIPQIVERGLARTRNVQAERNEVMRQYIRDIGDVLRYEKLSYAFLKGSVLSNTDFHFSEQSFTCSALGEKQREQYRRQCARCFYGEGERVFNDIDILILPRDISAVTRILQEMGFVQGYYDHAAERIVKLSRAEIISRRMNRGETAPFFLEIENRVVPFIEADVNFSLNYLPAQDEKPLRTMLKKTADFAGTIEGGVRSLPVREFFLHLIAHQYKESTLYSMVERHKDMQLYKLLDIYLFLSRGYIDIDTLYADAKKYRLEHETDSVLSTVCALFPDVRLNRISDATSEEVIDPPRRKKYVWTRPVEERLAVFDSVKYLSETENE